MNILHLVYDEKFIMFAAEIFGACDDTTNLFLVIVGDVRAPLKHVSGLSNMRLVDRSYFYSNKVAEDLAWCDCLVVHYLGIPSARMILRAPARTVEAWSGWGGDYYNLLPGAEKKLLGKATVRLLSTVEGRSRRNVLGMPTFLWSTLRKLRASLFVRPLLRKAISRADLFSAPISEDFALLKTALGEDLRAEYVQINYGSIERSFTSGLRESIGHSILVGNSASATNNHVEVFQALSKIDLGGRDVVVPLSYGDADYRDAVIALGRELFGDRFRPIVDYKPLDEYNALIAGCSVAVMGHRRQQALGNIVTMLQLGGRVFLDRTSTVYHCLTHRGAFVFGLDELEVCDNAVFAPLTTEQKRRNRDIVQRLWGHDAVLRNVRRFVEVLRSRGAARRA